MKQIVLAALLFGWIAIWAEDKPANLSDARAAIEANMKTPQGKAYDEKFGSEVMQNYIAGMRQCLKTVGGDAKSFWMLFRLKQDGTVREILLAPATNAGSCDRELLLKAKFSPPPRDDYWQGMYLNTGH
jgi:hypothetical protein